MRGHQRHVLHPVHADETDPLCRRQGCIESGDPADLLHELGVAPLRTFGNPQREDALQARFIARVEVGIKFRGLGGIEFADVLAHARPGVEHAQKCEIQVLANGDAVDFAKEDEALVEVLLGYRKRTAAAQVNRGGVVFEITDESRIVSQLHPVPACVDADCHDWPQDERQYNTD